MPFNQRQFLKHIPRVTVRDAHINHRYSQLLYTVHTVERIRTSLFLFAHCPLSLLHFSVSPLRIIFNQSHHVDDMTDKNPREQPEGRQHRPTPHLPRPGPAPAASSLVCLVKDPLHIQRQGHALPVGCSLCLSLAIHQPSPVHGTSCEIYKKEKEN